MNKFCVIFLLFSATVFSQNTADIERLHFLYKKEEFRNLPKATEYAKQAVSLSKKIGKDHLILQSEYYLVEALYKQRKIKEVEKKILFCINLAKKTNNLKILSSLYIYDGKIKSRLRNYTVSLKSLEKASSIAIKNGFYKVLHKVINAKAILYLKTKNNNKAITLLRNILNEPFDEKSDISRAYSNRILGDLYFNNSTKQNKDSSAYFYRKGISIIEKTENDYVKTNMYLNYGDLLIQKEEYKEALFYLDLAEEKALSIFAYSRLYFINTSLGIYYYDTKNYVKAIVKFQKALNQYGEYADGNQKTQSYWMLSGVLYDAKEYKEGFLYQEKLILLKDSLFTIDKNKTFEKLQTEYEVGHKNTKIALLEKQKELESQRKKIILIVSLLLFIPAVLLIIIYRYRIKSQKIIQSQQLKLHQKEKERLEQQQQIERIEGYIAGEEKEKNRISLELHDGIGGQLAGIKHYANCLDDSKEKEILQENLMNVTKEVRLLSHSLSYNYSIKHSINDLLEVLQEQYKNHFTIEFFIYPEEMLLTISDKNKLFLYRTLQELINNIYKYAKANTVTVSLTITDELVLIVEDDGVGFDEKQISKGIGLENIKERVASLLGEFSIDTFPNRGVSIIIKIPCN